MITPNNPNRPRTAKTRAAYRSDKCIVCLSRKKMPDVQWCETCEEIILHDKWDPYE